MQTKLGSFIEASVNTFFGLLFAFVFQDFFLQLVGITATFEQNMIVLIGMTVVSVVRSYLVRRFFNGEWAKKFKGLYETFKELLG